MNEISQSELIEYVKLYPSINDVLVTGEVEIKKLDDDRSKSKDRNFTNCNFDSLLISSPFSHIVFSSCTINVLTISPRVSSTRLTLANCKIDDLKIVVHKNSAIGHLEIYGDKGEYQRLFLKGGIRQCYVKDAPGASLIHCNIQGDSLTLFGSQKFDFFELSGNVEIVDLSEIHNCKIRVSDLVANEFGSYGNKDVSIEFRNFSIKKILFSESDNTSVSFEEANENHCDLDMGSGEYKKIHFKNGCNISGEMRSDFLGGSLKIQKLIFESANIKLGCYFNFERVQLEHVQFISSQNNGVVSFSNCLVVCSFEILNSSMGRCTLTNMDVFPGTEFDLLDSNIDDVSFNSFRWRNSFKLNEEYTSEKYSTRLNFLISLRESYRQLKANYLKSGNKIEALEFQRAELDTHLKILSFEKCDSLRNFGNYLIVGSNKLFSDFGQNIWKPLFYLGTSHLVLFMVIAICKFQVYPTLNNIDWRITWEACSAYFSTLLPTHSSELSLGGQRFFIWGFVDFWMRVFSGYFIFYFIYSSRKYHQ